MPLTKTPTSSLSGGSGLHHPDVLLTFNPSDRVTRYASFPQNTASGRCLIFDRVGVRPVRTMTSVLISTLHVCTIPKISEVFDTQHVGLIPELRSFYAYAYGFSPWDASHFWHMRERSLAHLNLQLNLFFGLNEERSGKKICASVAWKNCGCSWEDLRACMTSLR